jgi:DNA adenine methylase
MRATKVGRYRPAPIAKATKLKLLVCKTGVLMFSGAATQPTKHQNPAPPLKWAGGKRWLISTIAETWKHHSSKRYMEPFCGGLAIPLALSPVRAVLNDVNPHLINFYKQVRRGLSVTIEMVNNEKVFYHHRARFNELISQRNWESAEAAQLFYFLNRTGFNGLCRFNQAGEFNVPFGQHKSITYVRDFSKLQRTFSKWVFTSGDLGDMKLKAGDFVYADPPYDVEFTTYSAGGFSWDDQVRTAELLAAHDGPVLLSNQATARIVKLYKSLGFKLRYLQGPRRISCTGDRTAAKEVLASKNLDSR